MTTARAMSAAVLALLAVALAGCTAVEPASEFDRGPKAGAATGEGVALLVGVEISQTAEADRIAFHFQGDGAPAFRAAYVEPPIVEDGSGNPVEIAGERFVEIRMEPASGADLSGPELVITYPGPHQLPGPAGGVVREAARTGDFEAVLTWVVGADREVPFRVWSDTGPGRIVVEFARR